MTSRRQRRGAIVAAAGVMAAGLIAASATGAQAAPGEPDQQVDTSAEIGGGGEAPVIECSWALNDVDHDWSSDPAMNYGLDDSAASPGFPCQEDGDGAASQPDDVPTIQVQPNASDDPTEAYVELWAAVTSNTSDTSVYFDVFHPDGSFKVQLDATRYADSSMSDRCVGPDGMFDAAEANELMTNQARLNIVDECMYQQKGLYYGAFGISKHQPYGPYRVEVHASKAGGAEAIQTFFLEVLSFYQLEKDFNDVSFGPISDNDHFWQQTGGDFVWDGTDNGANAKTTVRNTGNAGIGLSVRFASMCLNTTPVGQTGCTDLKRIDHFDAKFGARQISNLQAIGDQSLETALTSDLMSNAKPAPPGEWYPFDDAYERVLCPNDTGKVEFSVWTESIPAGIYEAPGGIGLMARPVPICATDFGSVYMENGYSGVTPTSNNHH